MKTRTRHLLALAATALAVRLPLLLWSPGAPYDMGSYARVAACGGAGLYASPALAGRYPYLPLWWMLLKALSWVQGWAGGDPGLWFRIPGLAGDVAVTLLAYAFARRRWTGTHAMDSPHGERAALLAGLAWAWNPLAILISAGHGQFDSLALALVLGAAWFLEYSGDARADAWAAGCLALAVALKTWPLAFLPLCLGAFPGVRGRRRFALSVLLPPLLLLLPWLWTDSPDAVLRHLSYAGANALGLSGALKACFFLAAPAQAWRHFDAWFRASALTLLGLAFLWALLKSRRLRLLEALPWAALTMALLAPGLSPQYLIWAPALALAVSPLLAWRLSLAALPPVLLFYVLFMPQVLAGQAAWAAPRPTHVLIALWGCLNLAWCVWTFLEWKRLKSRNVPRRPAGRFF